MFAYDSDTFDLECPRTAQLKHRFSLDYGTSAFIQAGPKRSSNAGISRHHSIPSSPQHITGAGTVGANQPPKSLILIRRQSSDKYLQKRHSVDSNQSNNSDPGYSSTNNKLFLSPSQQRSPRDSNSPRNSSCSSMAFLSRQSSTNSSKLPTQLESEENLHNNKWYSSSSVILTRVKSMKEKFRRVVVQSSVQPDDWPPPSVLFSDRYKCPSSSVSMNSYARTSGSYKNYSHLVKSKSIDHSSFSTLTVGKKLSRNASPAGSGRHLNPKRLQRSMTTYTDSVDHGNGNDNGIICSDMDLKAIINTFKREEAVLAAKKSTDELLKSTQSMSKTPIGTSSVPGPGFGKRKLMRKQVSFDDEQGVTMVNRKVSAIAEEIECHSTFERQPSLKESINAVMDIDEGNVITIENVTPDFDDEENYAPEKPCFLSLLPKDVEFDEYGQTWEVYGADPDPEILGQAIQHHLERLMLCRHSISLPNGSAIKSQVQSIFPDHTEKSERVFKSLRVDLEQPENNLRFFARRLCGKWSCFSSDNRGSADKVIVSVDPDH